MSMRAIIRKNEYQDSVRLMNISKKASLTEGVNHVLVLLGTEGNKKILADLGMMNEAVGEATPNDLIVCIDAETDENMDHALAEVDRLLSEKSNADANQVLPESIEEGAAQLPGANYVLLSIPGKYARLDTAIALEKGLNVMLFSDNVSLEDEIYLKKLARERELLMMGPDCGTAIINSVCFGFANVIRKGVIGIVGASGTGIQEVTCLIDRMGGGISHAIGVGGRDLKKPVGGIMMAMAVSKLAADPATEKIVLISKPGDPGAVKYVMDAAKQSGISVTACFLGADESSVEVPGGAVVSTLEAAAFAVLDRRPNDQVLSSKIIDRSKKLSKERKYLRGLYSGGTLCMEALLILSSRVEIYSNIALKQELYLSYPAKGQEHYCIDMGEDEFTDGKPHPMIDSSARQERIIEEVQDPCVRVLLVDVMLGYGSCADPAGDIVAALDKGLNGSHDGGPIILAHVCGTTKDPQNLEEQEKKLEKAGVFLFESNAAAARAALQLLIG